MSVLAFLCINFSISKQVCIFCKVYSTIRILMILFVRRFFFVHGKFHVFFHAVFFTIKIIIVRTVSGISNRIFRIVTICAIEFFHQRHKAFHIGCIWFYVDYSYVFHHRWLPVGCMPEVADRFPCNHALNA